MGDRRTGNFPNIHVVDPDTDRRARIVRLLHAQSIHAEIYATVSELVQRQPDDGSALIHVGSNAADVAGVIETIWSNAGLLPVAFYSESPSPRSIVNAMLAGALDYLEWPFSSQALGVTVKRLSDLGHEQARAEARKVDAQARVGLLTPREREVLELLMSGESNKGIARALGISPRTVEIHRGHLMLRLDVTSTAAAVRIGLYAGLGEPGS